MGSQSFRSEQRITHRHLAPYACRTRYARGLKDPESETRLDDRALKALLEGGSGWRREGNALTKTYIFKGFKAAMNITGPDDVAIVLRASADNEMTSGLSREELLAGLSRHLPDIVNHLTPDGRLPTESEISGRL